MPRRTPETLADYLVVAICPTLIGLLVGSLLFFLVEVFYQGDFELRTLWVLAMFVLGIVSLARLSMEEGYAYASMYGVPLGVVVGIALSRFVHFGGPLAPFSLLVNWALMGWVWWCAHKLTWDCTLIDDSEDASGEGLLQQMGLDQEAGPAGPEATTVTPGASDASRVTTPAVESSAKEWWQKWIEPDRRPHPPGVWVVYFSLGALPMFGLGGRFLSPENLASRRWCFWMLVVYVATAMALLLATSFLGLRKYLRQRRLEMPLDMTATWVGAGTVLIVATIVVCAMLPRPSPEYSLTQVIKVDSPELWASRLGFGPEGGKSKSDQPSSAGAEQQQGQQADQQGGGKADPQNQGGSTNQGDKGSGPSSGKSENSPQGQSQQGQSQQGQSQQNQSQQEQSNQGKSKSDSSQSNSSQQSQSQGDQNQGDQSQSNQNQGNKRSGDQNPSNSSSKGDDQSAQQNQPSQDKSQSQQQTGQDKSTSSQDKTQSSQSPDSKSPGSSSRNNQQSPQIIQHLQTAIGALGGILKAAFYLALAIVAAVLVWRYRAELVAAWKKLLAELAALWPDLFGRRQEPKPTETSAPPPPRPFSQFADPFASGAAARMSPAEVVRYTFAALEAWGRENGCPRDAGQTPHEFAAAIGQLDGTLAREAGQLADLYARLAYAPPATIRTSFEPLRSLWQKMAAPAMEIVGA